MDAQGPFCAPSLSGQGGASLAWTLPTWNHFVLATSPTRRSFTVCTKSRGVDGVKFMSGKASRVRRLLLNGQFHCLLGWEYFHLHDLIWHFLRLWSSFLFILVALSFFVLEGLGECSIKRDLPFIFKTLSLFFTLVLGGEWHNGICASSLRMKKQKFRIFCDYSGTGPNYKIKTGLRCDFELCIGPQALSFLGENESSGWESCCFS